MALDRETSAGQEGQDAEGVEPGDRRSAGYLRLRRGNVMLRIFRRSQTDRCRRRRGAACTSATSKSRNQETKPIVLSILAGTVFCDKDPPLSASVWRRLKNPDGELPPGSQICTNLLQRLPRNAGRLPPAPFTVLLGTYQSHRRLHLGSASNHDFQRLRELRRGTLSLQNELEAKSG